ncbi:hypothetical protein TOPH_03282 [Tolypocladium ophioglossoides CBS 100239]|uniref:Rhodopsin domain-containing protein n=1 Tax=Tolypocladium ophioglossoides (strain CBS 100239) TaxID=1163406 RepID=A0A0L0ND28_TOLOC|nr:hypothetical protein TOPH_03282 [Tolypocladium ophioglossoides CBS 100239]
MPAQAPPANPDAPLTGTVRHVDRERLTAIIWTCFSLATCFLSLRLGFRFRQNRSFLADDYCIVFAWLCLLVMSILQTEQMDALFYVMYLTAGRVPVSAETGPRMEQLSRWQFPIIKLFWTVLWSVKASFLAIFYRLVKPFPTHRRLWYCVAVFTSLAYIGCVVASALTCSPPSDYFKAGRCQSPSDLWRMHFNVIFSTSVDITTDLMIMALPIALLPSLQLNARKKVGLGVTFSLATLIICVAIVRMTQVIVPDSVDLVGLAIWGAVETTTAIIVGSLPPLKALLSRGVKKYSTSMKSGQKYPGPRSRRDEYGSASVSRSVMVTESIPLDNMHRSRQLDGGIYVQKMFETHVEYDASSRDDDEAAIVRGHGRAI